MKKLFLLTAALVATAVVAPLAPAEPNLGPLQQSKFGELDPAIAGTVLRAQSLSQLDPAIRNAVLQSEAKVAQPVVAAPAASGQSESLLMLGAWAVAAAALLALAALAYRRRAKRLLAATVGTIVALAATGVAVANHPTIDPSMVPTGFLVAHNVIDDVPVSALARAVTPNGADVFVQHVHLDANTPTGWHTHPGPAIVTVAKGSVTYEDAEAGRCTDVTYSARQGFVDRGFGHVHRAIAGPDGVDFYVTYLLPRGSATHVIAAPAPEACA